MGVLLAALSAILYGSADFSGGLASRKASALQVLGFSQVFGLLVILVSWLFLPGELIYQDLLWGAGAGIAGAIGLAFLYKGLAKGTIAVVAPLTAVVGASVPVVIGTILGDVPTSSGWIGIGLGLVAILLLAWEKPKEPNTKAADHSIQKPGFSIIYGLVAGGCFGGFSILISQTTGDSGLWPLVASRITSLVVVLGYVLVIRKQTFSIPKNSRLPGMIAGIFDSLANVAFLAALRLTILPVVAVVSGFAPAPTVMLGIIVLKERIGPQKIIGLVLALAGIGFMSR
jgi:drug/metabolite transporter (DMT)-like permease